MADFTVVNRPVRGGYVPDALVKALLETEHNGKAIAVTLKEEDANFINWQATVRARVRKEGLKLRAKFNKLTKVATCWVEPIDADRVAQEVDLGVEEEEAPDDEKDDERATA